MAEAKTETKAEAKAVEEKVQNPLEAPVVNPQAAVAGDGTWQGGFLTMADELDAIGTHWLGNIFRDVGNPPVPPTKAAKSK